MQTPEVLVHTADNQQESKQPELNMSRRYSRRIVLVVVLGFVAIFAFVTFSVLRAPANTGWKGVVQNMHVPGHHLHNDYQGGVNLEEAEVNDNRDEDEQSQEEDLLKHLGDSRKIIDSDNAEMDENQGEHAEYIDDEDEKKALDNEPIKPTYKVLDENDERLQLPEVFLIRNDKGEVIGVKDVPKGLLDFLKRKNQSRDRQNVHENIHENGLAGEAMNPFLPNAVQADGNHWQGGNRQDGGFGRFGAQQGLDVQQGGLRAQQGGFGPQQGLDVQQGGLGAQQGGLGAQQGEFGPQQGLDVQQGGLGAQQGGFGPQQGGFGPQHGLEAQQGGFGAGQGGLPAQQVGFGAQQGGLEDQQAGFGNQQGGFGAHQGGNEAQQKGFGADQGYLEPQQGGFGAQQGGLEDQHARFGPHQPGFGLQQGGFRPQQGGLEDQQNEFEAPQEGPGVPQAGGNPGRYGIEKNIGQNSLGELKNHRMKTYGEFLQNKKLQNNNPFINPEAFQPPAGQLGGNNKYPDNFGGHRGEANQNEGFGWKNAFPGNANGNNINNNQGNGLDLMKDINQFLKNKNNALQNKPFVPVGNNNVPNNMNPFLRGNDFQRNPNQINQDGNLHEPIGAPKINNDLKNEQEKQRHDEEIKSKKEKRLTLLKQNIFMEDLTAAVTIVGNCVSFRFPTGSAPLCIHSADLDPNVSGKISAKEDYERDIMDQMLFILSNDTSLGFIDLGAGIGIYSMAAALLNREVLAVEPLKINCQLFHRSARENNVINKIVLLRQAIDNETYLGLVETSNSTGGYSEARISKLQPNVHNDQVTDMDKVVRVTTLNKIAPAAPFKRALLKIDVTSEMGPRILNVNASSQFFESVDVPYILIHWPFRSQAHVLARTVSQLIPLGYRPKLTFNGPDADAESLHSDQPLMVWKKQ